MKTRFAAMTEDSQQLAQLQGQVTSLQAEMATRAEIQSTREVVDRLTQMVQLLMDDRPRNPEKQPILNTENHSNTDSPSNHIHHHLDPNNHTHPHVPNPPPPTNLGGETHSSPESSYSGEGLKPKTVRLEFPRFDGEDPETWCCRAEQFFDMYCTPDSQRLSICAFHMDGKALVWFQELKASNAISSWTDFTRAIQIRFGRGPYDDPMETLSKLCQVGSLEDYKNQFDILALKVHRLPDEHKLSCFLGGLKDEIRLPVQMFNPKSLVDAYSLARIQEECLSNLVRGVRSPWRSTPFNHSPRSMSSELPLGNDKGIFPRATSMGQPRSNSQAPVRHGFNPNKGSQPNQALVPVQKITQAQMEERRRRGLCYSCDSKWTRGHVCTVPKLFLIEGMPKEEEEDGKPVIPTEEDPGEFFLEEFPEISLSAITGTPSPKTMRIVGIIRFHRAIVLIDSGSTHNFVDAKLAASLGIQPQPSDRITVQIANGQEVASPGRSREVEVKLQGVIFRTDLFILPLAGCDAVLGIQWLRTLGPILWDFSALTMQFTLGGVPCTLQGLRQGPRVNLEGGDDFKLPRLEKKGLLLHLVGHSVPGGQEGREIWVQSASLRPDKQPPIPGPVKAVLEQFEGIFQEPKGLPPSRAHDHSITLEPGAQPVSVRPYRYPYFQKEEIERIVQELLDSGVIRTSHSPFSSPVLLVSKT
jgi:hypothetical protein